MPGVYRFFTNSYRTESYGLLCVFLISMTAMDIVDQRKRGIPELVLNLLLCAFVGVWRTEGIILGVLLFLVQLLFIYRLRPRKSILCFLGLLLAFGLFSVPQKLGDIKYYGKDYSFINSLPTLKNILASPKSNLSYDGVTEDLEALGAVTPVEILRYYGMEGYRRYNYANGRGDINQSLADDETAAAYMRAYYRMVAHNLPIYAKTQISMLLNMLMIKPYYYVEYSDQLPVNDLPPWKLMTWEYGKEDLNDAAGVTAWKNSRLHILCVEVASKIGNFISGILRRIHFYSLVLVAIPLYEIFIFFHEGIRLLKKKKNRVGLALIAFILLGQAAAIILVMPAAALNYLHPYYYCSFALCLIYTCCIWSRKKETGKTEGEIWKK